MTATINENTQTLTITLPQRIDTSASDSVSKEIASICQEMPHEALRLDASQMVFISSSGLRIMLSLAKTEREMSVVNVSREVYNVFEMTGFTRMLKIERALREVSVEGCTIVGKGGVGTVYQLTDETIIKVFREGSPLEEVQREIAISKEAFVLGVPTAISFETVRVGEQYGLIFELINARTLSSIIADDTSKAEYYGEQMGRLMKTIHSIKDVSHALPASKEVSEHVFERLHRYFLDDEIALLREIYDAIPQGNSVLHCDLHVKNIMVSRGEMILIDMGETCYGNPLEDLAHTYSAMRGLVGDYQAIIGLDEEVSHRCIDAALRTYLDTDDEALIARRTEQIRVASLLRNISWLSLSDSFPQELVDSCRHIFNVRIASQMEHIREVLKEFKEWED